MQCHKQLMQGSNQYQVTNIPNTTIKHSKTRSESLGRDSEIMSTNGYRKHREHHITKIRISKIWKEDGDLQEKYERWDRLVKEIKEKYETRKKKNKGRKINRQLRSCIRKI